MHHTLYLLLNQVIFDLHWFIVISRGVCSTFITEVRAVFQASFLILDFARNPVQTAFTITVNKSLSILSSHYNWIITAPLWWYALLTLFCVLYTRVDTDMYSELVFFRQTWGSLPNRYSLFEISSRFRKPRYPKSFGLRKWETFLEYKNLVTERSLSFENRWFSSN